MRARGRTVALCGAYTSSQVKQVSDVFGVLHADSPTELAVGTSPPPSAAGPPPSGRGVWNTGVRGGHRNDAVGVAVAARCPCPSMAPYGYEIIGLLPGLEMTPLWITSYSIRTDDPTPGGGQPYPCPCANCVCSFGWKYHPAGPRPTNDYHNGDGGWPGLLMTATGQCTITIGSESHNLTSGRGAPQQGAARFLCGGLDLHKCPSRPTFGGREGFDNAKPSDDRPLFGTQNAVPMQCRPHTVRRPATLCDLLQVC